VPNFDSRFWGIEATGSGKLMMSIHCYKERHIKTVLGNWLQNQQLEDAHENGKFSIL